MDHKGNKEMIHINSRFCFSAADFEESARQEGAIQ
jgi:hypothetical protein